MDTTRHESVENPIWDVAKLVMAFLVVGIHTHVRLADKTVDFFIREWLGRFAVPMFLCLAGYFLFRKIQPTKKLTAPDTDTVKRYDLRILRMYVLWTCVYLIPQTVFWVRNHASVHDLLVWLEYAIVRGDSYLHLWYLSSLFAAVLWIYLTNRFASLRTVGIFALALYLFGLVWLPHYYLVRGAVESSGALTSILTFLNRFLGWPRNGTFFAFVFVVLGARLGKGEIRPIRSKAVWVLVPLCMALSFAEVWLIRRYNESYNPNSTYCALQISLLPATYVLFSALSQIRMQPHPVYRTLRKCSTLIYCLHPMVMLLVDACKATATGAFYFSLPFVAWIFVYAVTFALSIGWVKLEDNPRFRFLKVMH